MKKVFFGVLGLCAVTSMVVVMSCGGSGGGAPTAESTAASKVLQAVVLTGGLGGIGSIETNTYDYTCDGHQNAWTIDNIPCGFSGTPVGDVKVGGTYSCSDTNYTYAITETFEKSCTYNIDTCSMGDTIITGTVTVAGDLNFADTDASSFSFTIKSDKITLAWGTTTKDCAIELTFAYDPSKTYTTEAEVDNAFTGNICGADWTQTITDATDTTKVEALCTALNS